jgi:hypothetical protein
MSMILDITWVVTAKQNDEPLIDLRLTETNSMHFKRN